MAIDLRKNKEALLQAYNEVVSDKNNVDWAVFGYEVQTPVLKVVETGEGGLEEMSDSLNGSKIMYAYCKILDPNTNLPKYVLINWQGEAAPESMKFKCANHLPDIQKFFRGIHVVINARTEEDIDPDDVTKKVAKSSGSNYSFHKEKPKPVDSPTPVGSVYQRTVAARDINTKQRDQFWAEKEKEEQRRVEEDKKRAGLEKKRLDQERRDREKKEAEDRDKQVKERMKVVHEQKVRERRASQIDNEEEKKRWEVEQSRQVMDEEERAHRSEIMRKERAAEATKLTSSSASNARQLFKRRESQTEEDSRRAPPPPRKLRGEFLSQGEDNEQPSRKQPIQLPREEERSPPPGRQPSPPRRQPSPPRRQPSPPRREPSPPPREPSPPPREPSPPPREPSPPPRGPSPPRQTSPPPSTESTPKSRNLLAEGMPQRQDSDGEQDVDVWEDEPETTIPAVQHEETVQYDEQNYQQEEQPTEDQQYTGAPVVTPGGTVTVTALYDYQATDDTEISFDPGDIITNVEMIDEGWWTGTGPNGHTGMFPANYVEVME
ncbi:drebrin-like protein B isoform X1 [Mytilus californianus]|uniref:drebrin-like protein B isoform X1 n=1 Tax=Mytilus californianus TaxID=6549 RepID=UPI002246DCA4|nr:drebrin-like protein B isoform X1 [Mytilus californianus]